MEHPSWHPPIRQLCKTQDTTCRIHEILTQYNYRQRCFKTHLPSEWERNSRLRVKTRSIKTKTLLASLGLEYDATLAGIGTISFEEVVSRLRRGETRIKGQSEGLSDQNRALDCYRSRRARNAGEGMGHLTSGMDSYEQAKSITPGFERLLLFWLSSQNAQED
jgi:hypothetical protein